MPYRNHSSSMGDLQVQLPVLILDKVIHSDPKVVDQTARDITVALTSLGTFDDAELVALAIREAISNALVHGNRCDPEKTISISVAVSGDGTISARIKDSGSGFNPSALPNPLAAENLLSNHGRGIFLMRQFMDEVEFKFDHGTEVRMHRRQKWFE